MRTAPSRNGTTKHRSPLRLTKPSTNGHVAAVSDGANGTPLPVASGRTASGKFAKGNKLSRGNPFTRRLAAMRTTFLNAVSDEDIVAVAHKLVALAKDGDTAATTLLLSYALGKPTPATNPDAVDLDEYQLLASSPTNYQLLKLMTEGVAPGRAIIAAKVAVEEEEIGVEKILNGPSEETIMRLALRRELLPKLLQAQADASGK